MFSICNDSICNNKDTENRADSQNGIRAEGQKRVTVEGEVRAAGNGEYPSERPYKIYYGRQLAVLNTWRRCSFLKELQLKFSIHTNIFKWLLVCLLFRGTFLLKEIKRLDYKHTILRIFTGLSKPSNIGIQYINIFVITKKRATEMFDNCFLICI